jgi:ABC-type nitrate/sulfonate/bicarbonate transport system substrate-binding protein
LDESTIAGTSVRVCTFTGAAAVPIHVARERGYFAAAGLDVDIAETRGSNELMRGLLDGTFQVVHGAPDNVVAWSDREEVDIVAWIGLASGPVALVAGPEVAGIADLRGRRVAVDAPQSGFVSVLRRMLSDGGVAPDDVELAPIGATQLRYEQLRDHAVDATILTLPWLLNALDEGFRILAEQHDIVPRLQGSCGASTRTWLEGNGAAADAYLRGVVAALTWLYLPSSGGAVRELVRDRFGLSDRHAAAVCDAFLDPRTGWPPSARLDPAGMELVCALRASGDTPARQRPERYYTLDPYARVMGSSLLGATL